MAYVRIRPRRSTLEEWNYHNPILAEGEMGVEVPNTGVGTGVVKVKFGDGVTAWKDLPYGINLDEIEDKIDVLERNNSILTSEVDVRETSEIVMNDAVVTEPVEPTEPENPTTPTGTYEKIESAMVTVDDNSIIIVKLTDSATYAEIADVSDLFYSNADGDNYAVVEGVTSDTFTDLVTSGLWVKIEYVARFYPNTTSIYKKNVNSIYEKITITDDLGSTISSTPGELYFKVEE